jgi:uncharacterized protein
VIDAEPPSPDEQSAEASPDGWHTVSRRRLAIASRSRLLIPLAVLVLLAVITAGNARLAYVSAAIAVVVVPWFPLGRSARTWRYRERHEDLLIDHGLLVRRQVVVPYGRMQFVDIVADPVERLLGICTLRLHTASAASDARIPGLAPDDAQRLRDRLAALGEARMAGL